ncbi:dihydrofolate reductase [uncultured Rhodoblastus sp.]|uniref:dihydrofolate reductase n=1 Tax=uncultured Rhodoblastus sp. TaxID=543037 RepID=UPI0025DE1448|nr:dihydrofolate reductase [uncultured Rhodoblastus sp.]
MSDLLPMTLVAAIARNGALGKDNAIPWRASSDLRRFREITWGRPLIMGRKTFQSIGKPLPGRETIVVTRDRDFSGQGLENLHVAFDFEESVRLADRLGRVLHAAEIIVAGGAELYRLALPQAEYLRLTLVDCEPEADAFFPPVDWSQWRELRREKPECGARDDFALEYVDYQRR